MAPKKRKSSKTALKEEEQPEITLDFSEEQEAELREVGKKAEASVNTIVEAIKKLERHKDKATPLSEIEGIGPAYQNILKEHGIDSVQTLISADPDSLSEKTRFSAETVLEWQEKGKKLTEKGEKKETTEKAEEIEKTEKKAKQKEDKPHMSKNIKQNIEKLKQKEGIIGYILRNSKSASIDLNDPTKVIDYAVLSSSAFEASEELSNTFELGDVKNLGGEGHTVKLLSFTIGENKVSVFMEKNVDHKNVYKDLLD
jgi:predicted flap endonuclease-1-like 5' DNA nuclease/predicted regulator of Ras-like GTPase activity (Roadblock/LC7/MglB family)